MVLLLPLPPQIPSLRPLVLEQQYSHKQALNILLQEKGRWTLADRQIAGSRPILFSQALAQITCGGPSLESYNRLVCVWCFIRGWGYTWAGFYVRVWFCMGFVDLQVLFTCEPKLMDQTKPKYNGM